MSGRAITADFLSDIAAQYREHVAAGRMPAPSISKTEGAPVRTVHRWIYEARKRGLLEPGTPPGLCGGAVPVRQPGDVGHNLRSNVKALRKARALTYAALSALLADAGWPIPIMGLRRIEHGERRVDVDELVALASVFGVTPTYLLEPAPSCGTCHGAPPPGFACTGCGASLEVAST